MTQDEAMAILTWLLKESGSDIEVDTFSETETILRVTDRNSNRFRVTHDVATRVVRVYSASPGVTMHLAVACRGARMVRQAARSVLQASASAYTKRSDAGKWTTLLGPMFSKRHHRVGRKRGDKSSDIE